MIDKLNIGQRFIITYRPKTQNGEARATLQDGKTTRQITRRAEWDDKCKVVRDKTTNEIRYIIYRDLKRRDYRCAVGKVWITSEVA